MKVPIIAHVPAHLLRQAFLGRTRPSSPGRGCGCSNATVEHFLPVQLLGCTRLAHIELAGCRSVHLPPVLGELPALATVAVRDAKVAPHARWFSDPCDSLRSPRSPCATPR